MRRRRPFVVPQAVTVAKRVTRDGEDLGGDGDGQEQQRQLDELRRRAAVGRRVDDRPHDQRAGRAPVPSRSPGARRGRPNGERRAAAGRAGRARAGRWRCRHPSSLPWRPAPCPGFRPTPRPHSGRPPAAPGPHPGRTPAARCGSGAIRRTGAAPCRPATSSLGTWPHSADLVRSVARAPHRVDQRRVPLGAWPHSADLMRVVAPWPLSADLVRPGPGPPRPDDLRWSAQPRPRSTLAAHGTGHHHRHARSLRRDARPTTCSSRRAARRGDLDRRDVRRLLTSSPTPMLDRRLALDPQVALRPEPFGALAYHYGNRRLIFLKHPDVVARRAGLGDHATSPTTLRACAIDEPAGRRSSTALESLSRLGGRSVSRCSVARRAAEGRARRPDLPDVGADVRLQPGLRALPVVVGPARPARAVDGRGQGRARRAAATCRSSTSTSAAASR